jgi:hypothetical protein
LPYFDCPRCERRTYNPNDIEYGYCASCHWWTGDPHLGAQEPPAFTIESDPLFDRVFSRLDASGPLVQILVAVLVVVLVLTFSWLIR